MGRISSAFAGLKTEGKVGVIGYLTVGYPEPDATLGLVKAMVAGGATAVELGVPFSDPLADGATIQRSGFQALQHGVTLEMCLKAAGELRKEGVNVPILLMGYYNPFFRYGLDRLSSDCAANGVDGLIVPDLPVEEAGDLSKALKTNGVDLIFMVAPTSTDERIDAVCKSASGFIYCVSLTGVTGVRSEMSADLPSLIDRIRRRTDLPLAVGFGISTPEHVARVGKLADAAVVGSALIGLVENSAAADRNEKLEKFMRELTN